MSLTAIGFSAFLWERRRLWPQLVALTLLGLFGWQIVASAAIHPDYIAYFNEIASRHKDDYLLFGCDLDCGQDLWRLTHTLKARGITRLSIKLETSADLSRMDLPPFHVLEPYERATGWVAASVLFTRTGRAMWDLSDPQGWAWLNAYQPVQQVGNTIRLYYIPEDPAALHVIEAQQQGNDGGFSSASVSDYGDSLPWLNGEADIAQHPIRLAPSVVIV